MGSAARTGHVPASTACRRGNSTSLRASSRFPAGRRCRGTSLRRRCRPRDSRSTARAMDLEQATDELYAADLDAFVGERARLAKALREAGQTEESQAFAKLRKPTVAAWVLNQLARRNRREVDLLLDAGHRLREAQAGALSGAERARSDEHTSERPPRGNLV